MTTIVKLEAKGAVDTGFPDGIRWLSEDSIPRWLNFKALADEVGPRIHQGSRVTIALRISCQEEDVKAVANNGQAVASST